MADSLTPEKRSWNMSKIRSQDTLIEVKVRQYLFKKGFRFRKNVKSLPGKPDIVLKKYNTIIFIHGCFWHRHQNCKYATTPKTRIDFWNEKFNRNCIRDEENQKLLENSGWNVIIIWECELKKSCFEQKMEGIILGIKNNCDRNNGK